MSWFARSIANTLNLNDEDEDKSNDVVSPHSDDNTSSPRGVKEDISELTQTLTRQFWGVASFLAPPPPPPSQDPNSKPDLNSGHDESDPVGIGGLRSDFAEIGGKFRSGISQLSKNIPVSEITKMASNLLQLGDDKEDDEEDEEKRIVSSGNGGVVGVNEEVVGFVRDIAMHPETWLDFPLPDDDEDDEVDFDLSDVQQEHALAVERLAPRLAALRIELCPGYMSEARFWEIYFVLLHPRLDKEDALLLSTPQVVKARASLSQELRRRTKPIEEDWSKDTFESTDRNDSQYEEMLAIPSSALSADVVQEMSSVDSATFTTDPVSETEVHPVIGENKTVDKLVAEGGPITSNKDEKQQSSSTTKLEESDEDDGDDWLKEEGTDSMGPSKTSMSIENEEDVSFSDLEEDDSDVPANSKKVNYSSDKDSRDWVQLRKSSTDLSRDTTNRIGSANENVQNPDSKESNDWLDIDDIEVA